MLGECTALLSGEECGGSFPNLGRAAFGGGVSRMTGYIISGFWGWQDGHKNSFMKWHRWHLTFPHSLYNSDSTHMCSSKEKGTSVHTHQLVFKCVF